MDLRDLQRVICISTLVFTLVRECCAASTVDALNSVVLGHGRDIDPTSFIVTFEESSIAEPGALATIASLDAPSADVFIAAAAMRSAAAAAADRISSLAAAADIHIIRTRAFGHVFAGMSVQVATIEDAAKLVAQLKGDPAVKDVIPVVKSQMDMIRPQDPEYSAVENVQAAGAIEPDAAADPAIFGGVDESTLVDLAHTEYTGEGVKVGVLDDGLDFTHPVFGGCTAIGQGANCRVIAGHDFTDSDDITYESCGSHGTHVGGIIAGDSNPGGRAGRAGRDGDSSPAGRPRRAGRAALRGRNRMNVAWQGVAYKALLGAYRVFNCEGTVATDWLLGALDQAVADGMNIINLSMGTSWAAPLGLSFASRLARQGVLVVAAAGNDGSSGLWTYGHPAAEADAIAVGSTDNKYSLGAELTLNVNIRVDGQDSTSTVAATTRAFMGTPLFSLPRELVLPEPLEACEEIKNKDQLKGKVVLVSTGNCTEAVKATLLLAAGAASVLFYDHNPAPAFKSALSLGASVGEAPPQMFATDLATGQALVAALRKGTDVMIRRIDSKEFLNPNAEGPSWFSSWGPDINMRMLPTFSAPGGAILSSVPGNNFATFQGTSMATPYASGSLALWVQSRKEAGTLGTGKAILNAARSSFINTALPVKYDDHFVQSVVRVGSGLLQVNSAINNKVNVWPSTLQLPTGRDSITSAIALTNTGSEVLRYQLQHLPAMAVSTADAWYQQERQVPQAATVKFTAFNGNEISSVTLQPGQTLRIKVVITIDSAMAESPLFYSGYLRLVPITTASGRRRRVWAAGDASLASDVEAAAADSPEDAALAVAAADPNSAADIADGPGGLDLLDDVHVADTEFLADYPPLSIPYLGLSQPYSKLPVVANPRLDVPESAKLATNAALLCNVLTSKCTNAAGMKLTASTTTISIGLIGFALSLSRPVESLFVEVYDADTNTLLGKTSIAKGPLGWQGPKTLTVLPVHATASYWTGDYMPLGASTKATPSVLKPGNYRFVIVVEKPVAIADRETATASDYVERIEVMGQLEISKEDSFWGH